jgi:hypothetical protein
MGMVDDLKAAIKEAMKARDELTKSILRVALGEIQSIEMRTGAITEEDAQKAVRKLIASNTETIAASGDKDVSRLMKENEILDTLLPQQWDAARIAEFLNADEAAISAIRNAPNDGAAMGPAMKALKAAQAPIDGKLVGQVIKQLRTE